ncbi:MAG TPA: lipid A biosynthesis acyltransferase [Gammaproteobacteria bacterium]|nr:lipid A biosynthesis acyltransferase [Gammaproteobacteria bacterium]
MAARTTPAPGSGRWPSFIIRLLSRLPLPLLYLLADTLYGLLYHVFRFQRALVTDNLAACFPQRPEAEVRRLAAAAYRNALHILFETIGSLGMDDGALLERIPVENPELIESLVREHRTVITAAAHHGNWEWLQLASSARVETPVTALYKSLNRSAIDALLLQLRSRFGSRLLEARTALPELLKSAREPGVIALVADQAPRPEEEKYWGTLLGRDTAFYPGLERLARLFRAPVVFAHLQRTGRGRYRVRFEQIASPPYEGSEGAIMDAYIQAVERQIREAPQDWFWPYKRWKYQRPLYDSSGS